MGLSATRNSPLVARVLPHLPSMKRLAIWFCILLLVSLGATAPRALCERATMNALFVIFPYKSQGVWVFDDDRVGLVREPFVSGADDILDVITGAIPDAGRGVKLVFSAAPFPGYTARFVRGRSEYGGTWYRWPEKGMEGWLCPALFRYFDEAPKELFVRVSPKGP